MKVIIAGSRSITDYSILQDAVERSNVRFKATEIVSGTARGVDSMGEDWANEVGLPIKRFKPDWDKHGKSAGILRNEEMAKYADALLCIWDGKSLGSQHMIEAMKRRGKKVYVYRTDKPY